MIATNGFAVCQDKSVLSFPHASTAAGRKCQGRLWSTPGEVSDLLGIPYAKSASCEQLLFQHVQFKCGQRIHTIGQEFESLYVVNSGFLKTVLIDDTGLEQGIDFPMRGDILGIDGIHSKRYSTEAVALSDCNLIAVPLKCVTALSRTNIEFENVIYAAMSRELTRKQSMVSMLGATNAESKVARFLLFLADRYEQIGYSGKRFELRMTRQEIGNYLGLSLETISRTLSALSDSGLIAVDRRSIKIDDRDLLKVFGRAPSSKPRIRSGANQKFRFGPAWPEAVSRSLPN